MSSAPLVPPEVDLRDFPYMPLHVERLRRSKAWLRAKKNPEIGFYMLNLWAGSWHERPAGSLENDDETLAELAMCSDAKWPKVKEAAMRGWIECTDGRLYHPVVAEVAMDAWATRIERRRRTEAATAARQAKLTKHVDTQPAQRDVERDVDRDVVNNDKRDVLRDEQRNVHRDDNVTFTKGSRSEVEVKRSGREELQNRDVGVMPPTTREEGSTPNVKIAIENIESQPPKNANGGQKWDDRLWVNATALTVGKTQLPGEPFPDFRDRVYGAVQAKLAEAKRAVG